MSEGLIMVSDEKIKYRKKKLKNKNNKNENATLILCYRICITQVICVCM